MLENNRYEVKCLICGDSLKSLGNHLKWSHGISSFEYRDKFPGAQTVSKKLSEEYSQAAQMPIRSERQSNTMKQKYQSDPSLAKSHSEFMTTFWSVPENDEKMRKAQSDSYQNDPTRNVRISNTIKKNYHENPTLGVNLSKAVAKSYQDDLTRGRRVSESLRKTYRENPSIGEGISMALRSLYRNDPTAGKMLSDALRKAYQDDPTRSMRVSKTMKALWKDPEFSKHMCGNRNKKPNDSEDQLRMVLNKYFPDEWKYVGGGEVNIGGRLPDFVNINGKKQLVEMFGIRYHDPDLYPKRPTEEELIAHYKTYGFECLVIWEYDIFDEAAIVERVKNLP